MLLPDECLVTMGASWGPSPSREVRGGRERARKNIKLLITDSFPPRYIGRRCRRYELYVIYGYMNLF